jgi:hypothetical protein
MTNKLFYFILLINEYYLLIISAVLLILFFTILIDGFRLSDNKYITFLKITLSIVLCALFTENIVLTKESSETILNCISINSVASKIGIGTTVLNFLFFLITFCLTLVFDYLIKMNYLGKAVKFYYLQFVNKSYFFISFILFSLIFLILMFLTYFDYNYLTIFYLEYFNIDLYNNMTDSNNNSIPSSSNSGGQSSLSVQSVTNTVNDGTINVNDPRFRLFIPLQGVNNVAAAASAAGGVTAAIKAAQHMPGSPGVKLLAGAAAYGTVQTTTAVMSKLLNNNNNISNNSSNFIGNIINDPNTHKLNELYQDFPLNLLPEMNQLVNIEFIILFIFLNIFIVNFITKLNYSKYIPNNKLGEILNFFINRYIKLWSKSRMAILILCWFIMFICVIVSKLCLYYITYS